MKQLVIVLAAFSIAASAPAALALSMDYGSAEMLFDEPVTLSVTGKPQRASDVAAGMRIVTAEQIERSGASSIPEALRFVSGIDVRRYGQRNAAVSIRGYNTALNPRVLVLVDGRQVYQDDYGFTLWPTVPVTLGEIRQIEVIKGPNAALYGFNAVAGVINIVTYDPQYDDVDNAFFQAGTAGERYSEATLTQRSEDGATGLRLSAKRFAGEDEAGPDQPVAPFDPENATVKLRLDQSLSADAEWSLSASAGTVDSDYYLDQGLYVPLTVDSSSLRSVLGAQTRLGAVELDIYHNRNDFEIAPNARSIEQIPRVDWRQQISVFSLSDLVRLGNDHTLRIAGEYRHNSIESDRSFSGETHAETFAGALMWNWQMTPTLTWTNAVRYDLFEFEHRGPQLTIPGRGELFENERIEATSFNTGLVFKPSDRDSFRATIGRAHQLPSLLNLGVAQDFGASVYAGDPTLAASEVTNYELGYDRRVEALNSELHASVFYQESENVIGSPFGSGADFLPTGQLLFQSRNFASSSMLGSELLLEGENDAGYRWRLGYTVLDVDDRSDADELAIAPSVAYERQTPTHTVLGAIGRSWARVDLDLFGRWQSGYQDFAIGIDDINASPQSIDGYWLLNARLGYRLTDAVTLSLTGRQLAEPAQRQNAGRAEQRSLLAGFELDF